MAGMLKLKSTCAFCFWRVDMQSAISRRGAENSRRVKLGRKAARAASVHPAIDRCAWLIRYAQSNSLTLSSNFGLGSLVFIEVKCRSIYSKEWAGRLEEKVQITCSPLTYSQWSVETSTRSNFAASYLLWSAISLSCEVSQLISLWVALWKVPTYTSELARLYPMLYCLRNLMTR